MTDLFLTRQYEIVLADPPWPYYGDPDKDGAAGKEYPLMTMAEICALPVRPLFGKSGALLLWATSTKMHLACQAIEAWGLHFRTVVYVWRKTRQDGAPIDGQGVMPTFTKPTCEFLLGATVEAEGRPFPILSLNQAQVIEHPRLGHSVKPPIFKDRILELCGDRPRIELFARESTHGFDTWGLDAPVQNLDWPLPEKVEKVSV